MCDLQWSQVELATGRLRVRRAKNGSPSVHPMQGDEIRALRRLQCHNAPGDVRLAVRAADVTRQLSMEHEGIVHKLCPRQVLCVHHKLVRFNPLTYRGETGALAGEAAHTPNPIANKAAATENTMVLRI